MQLTDDQKFDLLKLEMELIQKTLDKYDDLIFRNRNWFITLWAGTIALSFTKPVILPIYALSLVVLFWLIEGLMRHQYWYKYVLRYRHLRDNINSGDIDKINIYDLTNSLSDEKTKVLVKLKACFLKLEPSVLYLLIGLCTFIVHFIR